MQDKARLVTAARFRALCSKLAGVEASPHFDRTAFRTPRRIFATLAKKGDDANVRLPLEMQEALVDAKPDVFTRLSGAWGAGGWTRVELAKVDDGVLAECLREAHALVATSSKRTSRRRSSR